MKGGAGNLADIIRWDGRSGQPGRDGGRHGPASVAERGPWPDQEHRVAPFGAGKLGQTPVEGCQASAVPNGQREQVGIGDLPVAGDALERRGLRISR